MATIVTPSSITPSDPADGSLPRIGYRNIFRDGAVTVSSELSTHPKTLAYDGLTFDGWQPTSGVSQWIAVHFDAAEDADYMAIIAHTLSGFTLTPQYSDDGVAWTNIAAPFTPSSNDPIVWEWDLDSHTDRRLLIEGPDQLFSLGAIYCGVRLTMPTGLPLGWSPPSLNETKTYTNVMSQGGQILGRTLVRKGASAQVETQNADFTFARDDYLDMVAVAETHAVFFWWVFEGRAEIMFGGMESSNAKFSTPMLVTTTLKITGINR